MGWLWSSSASSAENLATSNTNSVTTPAEPGHASPPASNPESLPKPSKRQPTRDEIAESELRSLLEELEVDVRPSSTKYSRLPQPSPGDGGTSNPSSLTLEEELLPTEMSCRQAFDAAFYCQSLGGQFNNLYRFGGIKSCGEHWNDFWFCMRTKSYTAEQKENVIRDHYKKKLIKYKVGPSSEDVWESRDEKLEWGEAFSEPVEAPAGSDEEWNRRERLRRGGRTEGTI